MYTGNIKMKTLFLSAVNAIVIVLYNPGVGGQDFHRQVIICCLCYIKNSYNHLYIFFFSYLKINRTPPFLKMKYRYIKRHNSYGSTFTLCSMI